MGFRHIDKKWVSAVCLLVGVVLVVFLCTGWYAWHTGMVVDAKGTLKQKNPPAPDGVWRKQLALGPEHGHIVWVGWAGQEKFRPEDWHIELTIPQQDLSKIQRAH